MNYNEESYDEDIDNDNSELTMKQTDIDTTLIYGISESVDKLKESVETIKSMLKFFMIVTIIGLIVGGIYVIRIAGILLEMM